MIEYGDGDDDDIALYVMRYHGVGEYGTLDMRDEHSFEWLCNYLDHL